MERYELVGLTGEEALAVERLLGRPPNDVELALYGVMWSEHCSYKSSRLHLRRLPTEGPGVLVGPGENAGVIDGGEGVAVAFRIESHNHPSAIEPHQGAATGVGGILRDVFTMGARPIALLDPLRLGPLDRARNRWLLEGIVSGISSYGNSVGVPTVGGELVIDECYEDNPLVNVFCLGLAPASRLVLAKASGVGNLAVLLGSTTGRDGIGGVSVLASAELGAGSEEKRPSVQVGDPFEEKRLIEACLELIDAGLVVGIQDLGGGGLACATSETAARAGLGMDVDCTAVARREPGMTPAEVMTSESQERMLAIVEPASLDAVLEVAARWEVRAGVVGVVTEPVDGVGLLRVLAGPDGPVVASVPAASLSDGAPVYDRPRRARVRVEDASADPDRLPPPDDAGADLLALLGDRSWVWRQYDHQLFRNTVVGPGGDAAVLRLAAPGVPTSGRRGLAISTDGNGRWCALEPRGGTAMVVAEAALNVACAGARPAALVNCLNLGNPEHPEVMWELSEVVDGLADASRALGVPVVGGNVSLYNASRGRDIDPTPVIGVVGLIDELASPPPGVGLVAGTSLVLLGSRHSGLGASRWGVELRHRPGGSLPPLDLGSHASLVALVHRLVAPELGPTPPGVLAAVHDVSDGGLAVALAEMAAAGGVGAHLGPLAGHGELFSEAGSRVLICTPDPEAVLDVAAGAGVPAWCWGEVGGDRLVVDELLDLPLTAVLEAQRCALGSVMEDTGAGQSPLG